MLTAPAEIEGDTHGRPTMTSSQETRPRGPAAEVDLHEAGKGPLMIATDTTLANFAFITRRALATTVVVAATQTVPYLADHIPMIA
jgi:hypothetical protein